MWEILHVYIIFHYYISKKGQGWDSPRLRFYFILTETWQWTVLHTTWMESFFWLSSLLRVFLLFNPLDWGLIWWDQLHPTRIRGALVALAIIFYLHTTYHIYNIEIKSPFAKQSRRKDQDNGHDNTVSSFWLRSENLITMKRSIVKLSGLVKSVNKMVTGRQRTTKVAIFVV